MEVTLCPTPKPHFLVIPWPTSSHMIPMVDIGCLLAAHGAPVTIITTPASSNLVQSRVDRTGAAAAASITVTALPFPGAVAGLPDGCERLDHVPSVDLVPNFFDANARFGDAVAEHCLLLLRQSSTATPSFVVVAGMCNTWAVDVARELGGAPCFIFHGFGAFALLCCEYLNTRRPHEAVASPDELFAVPVLPPPFEFRFARRQLPLQFLPSCSIPASRLRELREFETAVDGIVVNSFEELELDSAARLAAATGGKAVLAVGPVSLCGGGARLSRRLLDADDDDARRCMAWLDAKKSISSAASVLYVSFGSAGRMPPAQVMELGQALVSCPWPVLWVIKGGDALPDDVTEWLQRNTTDGGDGDGLPENRRCLVVRGWAPQVAVLEHPAVGGFLTHCGWGSTLESVAAGVPMATWPFSAEQFLNEKLIVDVLGVGVSVGVTKPTVGVLTGGGGEAGKAKADVGMEQVKRALDLLMDGGADAEARRTKAKELKAKAKSALEHGGSSYMNLEKLIRFSA